MTRYMKALRAVDHDAVSRDNDFDTGDESIVQQQFAGEVDINTIVRRFGLSGLPITSMDGVYGDFTGVEDYQSARDALARIDANFMLLPAEVRDEFDNDPGKFMDYMSQRSPDEAMDELTGRLTGTKVPPADSAPPAGGGAGPVPEAPAPTPPTK